MKKIMMFAALGAFSFCLAGCDNMKKQDVGVITGGVIGGLVGSQFGRGSGQVAAAALGAVAGGFIGGQIGHSMDKVDQMRMQQVLEKTPSNRATCWRNPDTNAQYTMTPKKTYYVRKRPCREYVIKAWINGKQQYVHGRACRMPDGTWKAVK